MITFMTIYLFWPSSSQPSMSPHTSRMNQPAILEHRFPARARELAYTRAITRTSLNNQGWGTDTVEEVVLAIDEACQNIIRHAYRRECDETITLHIHFQEETLVVVLEDTAPAVSPNCMKPRAFEDLRPGGLGCHFIQQVMDQVSIGPSATGQGNTLRMVKHLQKDRNG